MPASQVSTEPHTPPAHASTDTASPEDDARSSTLRSSTLASVSEDEAAVVALDPDPVVAAEPESSPPHAARAERTQGEECGEGEPRTSMARPT